MLLKRTPDFDRWEKERGHPMLKDALLARDSPLWRASAERQQLVIQPPGLVWAFNVVGPVDLLNALRHVDVAPNFGATWYIPTMLVPLLLVTHFLMFKRLLAREQ